MPYYSVLGSVTGDFAVCVTASNKEDAASKARALIEMDLGNLLDNYSVDILDVAREDDDDNPDPEEEDEDGD